MIDGLLSASQEALDELLIEDSKNKGRDTSKRRHLDFRARSACITLDG